MSSLCRGDELSSVPSVSAVFRVDGIDIECHLAGAPDDGLNNHGLVIAHGFPSLRRPMSAFGETYPHLADRLAADTGWSVLSVSFRGTGNSGGDFSLGGWLADLRGALSYLRDVPGINDVWVAGFGTGGSLGLCAAAEDELVRGVASFGSPADFHDWAAQPEECLERARGAGAVRSKNFPPNFDEWALELADIKPDIVIGKIAPRPIMIVHGAEDDVVSPVDARVLAQAGGGEVELRVLGGAGHDLRHDPRAVALLMGWLDRQSA